MGGGAWNLSLSDSVCWALSREGVGLLESPVRFQGYLMDFMDPDLPEYRVLARNCDEGLLSPYVACAGGPSEGYDRAVTAARNYLETSAVIDSAVAEAVARGIAQGVAVWYGVAWDMDATNAKASHRHAPSAQGNSRGLIPGVYVDAQERAHIMTLVTGDPREDPRFDLDVRVVELRSLRRTLASLLDRRDDESIDVVIAASDLSFDKYIRINDVLRESGIFAIRWCLPTGALGVGGYYLFDMQGDADILAVHVGAERCTMSLIKVHDKVFEYRETVRADVRVNLYERLRAVGDLAAGMASEPTLSAALAQGTLRVFVMNELGHDADIARALQASLSRTGGVRAPGVTMLNAADAARGLAVRGGVLSKNIFGVVPVETTWFDVLLEGQADDAVIIGRNHPLPTRNTDLMRYRPEDHNGNGPTSLVTGVVLVEPGGRGIRFPIALPPSMFDASAPCTIETTVELDASARGFFEARCPETKKIFRSHFDSMLNEAKLVTIAEGIDSRATGIEFSAEPKEEASADGTPDWSRNTASSAKGADNTAPTDHDTNATSAQQPKQPAPESRVKKEPPELAQTSYEKKQTEPGVVNRRAVHGARRIAAHIIRCGSVLGSSLPLGRLASGSMVLLAGSEGPSTAPTCDESAKGLGGGFAAGGFCLLALGLVSLVGDSGFKYPTRGA